MPAIFYVAIRIALRTTTMYVAPIMDIAILLLALLELFVRRTHGISHAMATGAQTLTGTIVAIRLHIAKSMNLLSDTSSK
jgi:hypothetical protein